MDLASCRHLAHLGAILGLPWPILAPILAHLAPLLAHLAPLLAYLGASWVHLGTEIPTIGKTFKKKQRFSLLFEAALRVNPNPLGRWALGGILAHLGAILASLAHICALVWLILAILTSSWKPL